jgi:co-chaperonin GroES (HSP10)
MSRPAYSPSQIRNFKALGKTIVVTDMKFDDRITANGIILMNDDKKSAGIRPRWAKIYAIGPDQLDTDLQVGKYILISHGRWTRGITVEDETGKKTLRKVDENDILIISDIPMDDETMSTQVY